MRPIHMQAYHAWWASGCPGLIPRPFLQLSGSTSARWSWICIPCTEVNKSVIPPNSCTHMPPWVVHKLLLLHMCSDLNMHTVPSYRLSHVSFLSLAVNRTQCSVVKRTAVQVGQKSAQGTTLIAEANWIAKIIEWSVWDQKKLHGHSCGSIHNWGRYRLEE